MMQTAHLAVTPPSQSQQGFWTNIKDKVYEQRDSDGFRCEILCAECNGCVRPCMGTYPPFFFKSDVRQGHSLVAKMKKESKHAHTCS